MTAAELQADLLAGARKLFATTWDAYLKARAAELETYAEAARNKTSVAEHFWQARHRLEQKAVALRKLIDVLEEEI